jgi:hypothetical protein
VQGLAARNSSNVDGETVAVRPVPADEALAELRAAQAYVTPSGGHGLVSRDGSRRLDLDVGRTRLGNQIVTVEQTNARFVAYDGERALERRGEAKSDLDRLGIEVLRDPTARVPPIRRAQRPSKASFERDLHVRETVVTLGL